MKSKTVLLLISLIFSQYHLLATHNRAGEIIYEQLDATRVLAKIKTYTKASSQAADRDSLEICWGDGSCQWVVRTNGVDTNGDGIPDGEMLGNDVKLNIYAYEHTYLDNGQYTISMTDPNRNAGILNVNFPSSDQIPFFLATQIQFSSPATSINHSPIPTMHPIDNGVVGLPFFHSPNAYDPDGDSLAYELITPFQAENLPVPNYRFPNEIQPGPENNFTLDATTGLFIWFSPQQAGEYNIAILIKEYRNGELIGQIIRDMQFYIGPGGNFQLPTFENPAAQVTAQTNETLELSFQANSNQPVRLYAYGEPLLIHPVANFQTDTTYAVNGTATGTFTWEVTPALARTTPHRLILKAETIDKVISVHLVEISVDGLVNVKPINLNSTSLHIFPNPVNQVLQLNLKGYHLQEKGHIRLYNVDGKLCLEKQINPGESQWNIQTDHLVKGIYYVRLTSANTILEEKLIKQ